MSRTQSSPKRTLSGSFSIALKNMPAEEKELSKRPLYLLSQNCQPESQFVFPRLLQSGWRT